MTDPPALIARRLSCCTSAIGMVVAGQASSPLLSSIHCTGPTLFCSHGWMDGWQTEHSTAQHRPALVRWLSAIARASQYNPVHTFSPSDDIGAPSKVYIYRSIACVETISRHKPSGAPRPSKGTPRLVSGQSSSVACSLFLVPCSLFPFPFPLLHNGWSRAKERQSVRASLRRPSSTAIASSVTTGQPFPARAKPK